MGFLSGKYTREKPGVSTLVLGASKLHQLEDNLGARTSS